MTEMLVRQMPITAPQRQSPPGSILDCATVIDVDNLWTNFAGGFWTSAGCGSSQLIADPLCTDVEGEPGFEQPEPPATDIVAPELPPELAGSFGVPKAFYEPVWAHAHTFGVYRSLACNPVGFTLTTTDLENAFDAAEGRAVAKAVWSIYDPLAVDVAGAGAEAMCNFGLLADYTMDQYGGQPVFLLPATMAVALESDRVLWPKAGGGFETAVGGCVAIGAAMTSALALGLLVILRTPRVTREVIDPRTNMLYLLTERLYQVGVDCDFAAKIPDTINCGALP